MITFPAAVMLLGLLGGCALNGGSGQSSADARASLYELLDDTQTALGGEWQNQDDPTSRGCVIPLWVDGELYPALRVGPPPADADSAIAAVSDLWTERKLALEDRTVGAVHELQGRSDIGAVFILRLSEDATTLQGESECRPTS